MFNNKKNILSWFVSLFILTAFVVPLLVQADDPSGKTPSGDPKGNTPSAVKINFEIKNPFKEDTIEGLIKTIIRDIFIPIGGVIAVVMIIYAGFLYVTARGNPTKITQAHQALLWATIGAAILLGAWVISTAITATINSLKAP